MEAVGDDADGAEELVAVVASGVADGGSEVRIAEGAAAPPAPSFPTAAAAAATAAAFSGGTLGVFTGKRGELFLLREEEKNRSGFSDAEEAASNLARPLATAPTSSTSNSWKSQNKY